LGRKVASPIDTFAVVGRVFDPSLGDAAAREAAKKSCDALEAFLQGIGLRVNLGDLGIPKDELKALAKASMILPDYKNHLREATPDEILEILKTAAGLDRIARPCKELKDDLMFKAILQIPEKVISLDIERPVPGPGQVLIKVERRHNFPKMISLSPRILFRTQTGGHKNGGKNLEVGFMAFFAECGGCLGRDGGSERRVADRSGKLRPGHQQPEVP
jgi:hypothetical protein